MDKILDNLFVKYFLYLFRWQCSTPILAPVVAYGAAREWSFWTGAAVANLIGGLIFFWVDKFIFKKRGVDEEMVDKVMNLPIDDALLMKDFRSFKGAMPESMQVVVDPDMPENTIRMSGRDGSIVMLVNIGE